MPFGRTFRSHRGDTVWVAEPYAFADELVLLLGEHFADFYDHLAPKDSAAYARAKAAALVAAGEAPLARRRIEHMDEQAVGLGNVLVSQAVAIGVAIGALHRALTGQGRRCADCDGMGVAEGLGYDCRHCHGSGVQFGPGVPGGWQVPGERDGPSAAA